MRAETNRLLARVSLPKSDWRRYAASAAVASTSATDAAIIYTHSASPEVEAMPGLHTGNITKSLAVGEFNTDIHVRTPGGTLKNQKAHLALPDWAKAVLFQICLSVNPSCRQRRTALRGHPLSAVICGSGLRPS